MSNFSLFSVIGIEIEYMLVDKQSLDVRPIADELIHTFAGEQSNSASLGDIEISNELVMHVVELKNNGPRSLAEPIEQHFLQAINQLQPWLNDSRIQLLPTGAHPWMDPHTQTKRWPHGDRRIYQQFDKIFDCRGHGWSNLQSMHINLPFANDKEFAELHSVVRLLLPLLPALAASTPILEKKFTGFQDSRLVYYGQNQKIIPSISGEIIPEVVFSEAEYVEKILKPMYQHISSWDTEGILQFEWLNSRGAIAKFEYNALEIRIVDSQECVQADVAIARLVHAILKHWHEHSDYHLHHPCPTSNLKMIYDKTIQEGLSIVVDDEELLTQWQLPKRSMSVREIWSTLIERVSSELPQKSQQALEHILRHGNLSERILQACQNDYSQAQLHNVYQQLATCLLNNSEFLPQ